MPRPGPISNIVRKIVALAELRPSDHVLEIGPGRGILTEALSRAAGHVTAVEVDSRLHAYLETRQGELPNVELVCEDALAYPVESLPVGTMLGSIRKFWPSRLFGGGRIGIDTGQFPLEGPEVACPNCFARSVSGIRK